MLIATSYLKIAGMWDQSLASYDLATKNRTSQRIVKNLGPVKRIKLSRCLFFPGDDMERMPPSIIELKAYTLEEARDIGFDHEKMQYVYKLKAGPRPMDPGDLKELLSSAKLSQLQSLDISGQNLTDDPIKLLSQNKSLGRLHKINLANNPDMTIKSLRLILESDTLGAITPDPVKNEEQELYVSTLRVNVDGTSITPEDKDFIKQNPRQCFNIHCLDIDGNAKHDPALVEGIKRIVFVP